MVSSPTVLLVAAAALVALMAPAPAVAKTFERCALARELRDRYGLPYDQLANWICIVNYESHFDTAAVGRLNADGSLDHGIFQISDKYWCSPPGQGTGCGLTCARLEDDDISDDVTCARRIYDEHQRISGDGFNAWTTYPQYCNGGRSSQFLDGCF